MALSTSVRDALAVPAPPDAISVTQPDGTMIRLTLLGDETNLRAEDEHGYTALGVATPDGTQWRYAVPDASGLTPSALVVGRDDPSLLALPPHLGWPREVVSLRALRPQRDPLPGPPSSWLRARAGSDATGSRRHQRPLVVLVAFPGGRPADMPGHSTTPAQFGALLFARGLDPVAAGLPASYTASVADYFAEVSRDQWTFSADDSDVVGWVTVPRDYEWYVAGAHGLGPAPRNADTLLVDVAAEIDDLVDFNDYDLDADGHVDNVIMVVEGWSDGSLDQFWPFTSRAPSGVLHDGVELSTYVVVPERMALSQPEYGLIRGEIHAIGTLCHELGNVLGLPDLGDPDDSSSGVGVWSLMGSGAWRSQNHPSALDAWSRMMLGWEQPVELDSGPIYIDDALGVGGASARIWIDPYRDGEFFLLENRQRSGTDRHLPGGGLLIWHIDEARRAALDFRAVNADEDHPAVALEQADGRFDLSAGAGTGDAGDPYPGSARQRDFGAATVPDSRTNQGDISGVRVSGIGNAAATMTANVTAPERWGYRLSYDTDATRSAGLGDNFVAVRFTAPPAGDGIAYALVVWAHEAGAPFAASLRVRNLDDRPGRTLWSTSGVLPAPGWNRVPVTTHLPLAADESIFGVVRYGDVDDPIRVDDGPAEAGRSLYSGNGTFWQVAPGNIALRLLVDQCPDFDGDGARACKGDCDDQRADTHPTALEVCNGIDDDCGGDVDEGFADSDDDGVADCVDPDDDDDGAPDEEDVAPLDPRRCQDVEGDGCDDCGLTRAPPRPDADGDDVDGDGLCDSGDDDDDGDDVRDADDPAPRDPMRCGDADADGCDDCALLGRFDLVQDGPDADADGTCDASDDDDDGDGVPDAEDAAPLDAFRCADSDGDGCDDCAVTAGPPDPADDGVDTDADGVCDVGDDDDDGDTIPDGEDVAPADRLRCADADGDGCDDCAVTGGPPDPANDGLDTDADGTCDAGDPDDDGDGVPDEEDVDALDPTRCVDVDADGCDDCALRRAPPDPHDDGTDTDGDGACDLGDDDIDGDGAVNVADRDPLDAYVCGDWDDDGCDDCSATGGPPDGEHDGTDIDRDGICDAFDPYVPREPTPVPRVDDGCRAGRGGAWSVFAVGLLAWITRSRRRSERRADGAREEILVRVA